jgi:hypothetical protein
MLVPIFTEATDLEGATTRGKAKAGSFTSFKAGSSGASFAKCADDLALQFVGIGRVNGPVRSAGQSQEASWLIQHR